jgi:hypothetical protein
VAKRKVFTLAHRQPGFRLWPEEGFSGLAAIASAVALLALLTFGIKDYVFRPPPAPAPGPTEADYRVGSILFVPYTGATKCEARGFDNKTGQIVLDRTFTCDIKPEDVAAADAAGGKAASQARMKAILDAFKK